MMFRSGPLLAGSVLALVALVAAAAWAQLVEERARELEQEARPASKRRAIFFSEAKLRAVIESTNDELRQLKRDFMAQMTDVYLGLKLDPAVSFEEAREAATSAATANVLLAEEFATMAIKKHLVQRRLLTGLKLAFTKMLPMQTLVNLFRRYKSFEWLRDQEQVELRARFPGAKESQFVVLYSLIELRARARAADDLLALTADHQRRILQLVQWYLVESRHGGELAAEALAALARNAKLLLQFYQREVLDWRDQLHRDYESFARNGQPLAQFIGGQHELTHFIDRLIDVEALDIELSAEAQRLAFPPTINEQMIASLQKRWLPWYVLKSLEEDRQVLLANRKRVMHLVRLEPKYGAADLREWTANLIDYLCHNEVQRYGRFGH